MRITTTSIIPTRWTLTSHIRFYRISSKEKIATSPSMTLQLMQGKKKKSFTVLNIYRIEGQSELITSSPIIIFEGILSLYDARIRELMDIKIFVLTDDDIRLSRRCKWYRFLIF
jgi:hypothetical protein